MGTRIKIVVSGPVCAYTHQASNDKLTTEQKKKIKHARGKVLHCRRQKAWVREEQNNGTLLAQKVRTQAGWEMLCEALGNSDSSLKRAVVAKNVGVGRLGREMARQLKPDAPKLIVD